MKIITSSIKGIMVVAGLLTMTMLYAAIAPAAALQQMFGDSVTGPLAEIIVRNWAALIALGGAALIYGAFEPGARKLALLFAIASKLVFVGLILNFGKAYLSQQAGIAVGADLVMVALFILYLVSPRPAG